MIPPILHFSFPQKYTLYHHSTTNVSIYVGNVTAVVSLTFISLIDCCILSLYLHIVLSSVITEDADSVRSKFDVICSKVTVKNLTEQCVNLSQYGGKWWCIVKNTVWNKEFPIHCKFKVNWTAGNSLFKNRSFIGWNSVLDSKSVSLQHTCAYTL